MSQKSRKPEAAALCLHTLHTTPTLNIPLYFWAGEPMVFLQAQLNHLLFWPLRELFFLRHQSITRMPSDSLATSSGPIM